MHLNRRASKLDGLHGRVELRRIAASIGKSLHFYRRTRILNALVSDLSERKATEE